jgi:2-polyprenyl-6-methoxyphenol hydroxylase-like FAD-dependent oxidoreductase
VVVSEEVLLNRIQSGLPALNSPSEPEAAWKIFSSRPLPRSSEEHHFGSRMATASAVTLKPGCDPDACWIESLDNGWLFLLPGVDRAWLLSVGDSADALLAQSRLIGDQIDEASPSRGTFPSHPRIADPLCEPGWLACGTAALGFDPLCGDGTGHATREAILASAVVRAAIDGSDVDVLVAHYRTRLLAGFKRHLDACREFYRAGRSGPWWDQELNSLDRGLDWCGRQLESAPRFRFRLSGFALEAIDG